MIRRLLENLTGSEGSVSTAVEGLVEELGVGGVCLAELGSAEPVVRVAAGEIAPDYVDPLSRAASDEKAAGRLPERIREPWSGDAFIAWEEVTGLVSDRWALAVVGDFAGRTECRHLLAIVLHLLRRRLADAPAPRRRHRAPDLVFPDGYVRGVSPAMTTLYDQMRALVQGDVPVLIRGATGVGKEYLARIIHFSSARKSGPLVAINCAAIPSDLLEAELFGIGERVATGVSARRGRFQQAQGGTLFLDEIVEMPRELQAKLLRALQEQQIHPLGLDPLTIDVRVVAATDADVFAHMEDGTFRRDLFYRLAGFVLRVPSLTERREDIPLLVERFIEKCSAEIGKPVRGITVRALQSLVERDWPGNVRELEHEVRRLVYLCASDQAIEFRLLGLEAPVEESSELAGEAASSEASPSSEPDLPTLSLDHLERLAIAEALRRTGDNQVRAAELLGISRHGLRRRKDRHGI